MSWCRSAPTLDWKKAHAFTSQIAAAITQMAPDTFTAVMGAENRKRRIFIDFHRNARSATAAAPYSPAGADQPAGFGSG